MNGWVFRAVIDAVVDWIRLISRSGKFQTKGAAWKMSDVQSFWSPCAECTQGKVTMTKTQTITSCILNAWKRFLYPWSKLPRKLQKSYNLFTKICLSDSLKGNENSFNKIENGRLNRHKPERQICGPGRRIQRRPSNPRQRTWGTPWSGPLATQRQPSRTQSFWWPRQTRTAAPFPRTPCASWSEKAFLKDQNDLKRHS